MTSPVRLTALLCAAACSFGSAASAGPIGNLWNNIWGYGPYQSTYAPAYGGYGYGGVGYDYGVPSYTASYGSACCSPCGVCGTVSYGYAPNPCSSCGSSCGGTCGATYGYGNCGSCGSCGQSNCGQSNCGGNCGSDCIASAPSLTPERDNPPKTFEEEYLDPTKPKDDGGFEPRDPADPLDEEPPAREALKPTGEESAIPMKKAAPTPAPGVDEPAAEARPLRLDDRLTWTATPQRTRIQVKARFGSPAIARTRIAADHDAGTVPVSTTRIAEK